MTLKLPGRSSSKRCAEAASFTICKKNCFLYATNDEDEKRKKDKSTGIALTRDEDENRQNSCSKVSRTHTS